MIDKKEAISEKAVLIGLITVFQNEEKSKEYLDELAFLAHTAGALVNNRFTQKLDKPHYKTFLGRGKLEELREYISLNGIEVAIFDDELSPAQLRNIEKSLNCKVLDRTTLILDIFAQRAKTSYARTQVELAQCQYFLPRLTRLWTHLDKQKGGIGLRGPGETEIETDRRILRNKITLLKKKLQAIDMQMAVQRKNRIKMVRVALVGYTNVGKSTLMNLLSKSDVFVEDKLFATLDTTIRKVVLRNLRFLLTDTVGFIRKLPTQLIESFKSTLDEVRQADLLLHIVDISHPNFDDHIASVNQILKDIDSRDKPIIVVFNKIDKYIPEYFQEDDLLPSTNKRNYCIDELKKTWFTKLGDQCTFISAFKQENIEDLKSRVYIAIRDIYNKRFPYDHFLYTQE